MKFQKTAGLVLGLIFFLVKFSAQHEDEDPDLCSRKVDLVFVMDGSNSLGQKNFNVMKSTIAKAVDVLSFGINQVRASVVLYSSIVNEVLPLQTNKTDFQRAVLQFEYPDEATNTDLAITQATEILTSSKREDVPLAMVIVTDGASTNPAATEYAALVASSRGIDIWAVGVSALADMEELSRIATNGSRQTLEIETFDLIPDQLINLTRTVCNTTIVLSTFSIPTTTTTPTPPPSTSSPDTASTSLGTSSTTEPTTNTNLPTITTQDTTTTLPTTTTQDTTTTLPPTTTQVTTTTTLSTTTTQDTTTTTAPITSTTQLPTTNVQDVTTTPEITTTTAIPITTTVDTTTTTAPTASSSTTQDASMSTSPLSYSTPAAPPEDNPDDSLTDLCKNSPSIGGVGYVLYPGDCTKVLQCYHNPITNKTLVVTRQCPKGQFWDQSCMKCLPSWKVDCPYDKCKPGLCTSCVPLTDSYSMDGVCGGFWSCYNGRSYPKCCPPCYSYLAGYGCMFGNTCFDKCGPDDDCLDGLGVCEKIPIWENVTEYAVATDLLGLQWTTCSRSDFSIGECRCEVKLMDIFKQDNGECKPYHESNTTLRCSGESISVPVKQLTDIGTLAFKIWINITSPQFEITSTASNGNCDHASKIRIWADDSGIHSSIGDAAMGRAVASVLLKNLTGELEISVMLHQGKLTLGVKKGLVQFIATVKGRAIRLCSDCVHSFAATSNNNEDCLVNKVQLYNCKPEVTDIYATS